MPMTMTLRMAAICPLSQRAEVPAIVEADRVARCQVPPPKRTRKRAGRAEVTLQGYQIEAR